MLGVSYGQSSRQRKTHPQRSAQSGETRGSALRLCRPLTDRSLSAGIDKGLDGVSVDFDVDV